MNCYTVSPLARADLKSIWDYIAVENGNPTAANALLERFCQRFALLATEPLLGELRDDLRPGLRAFVVSPYVIFYYPVDDGIEVAGVVHGARNIKSMFDAGER